MNALRELDYKITIDFGPLLRAFIEIGKAAQAWADAMTRLFTLANRPLPESHSFRPDFDLACTMCSRAAEDH